MSVESKNMEICEIPDIKEVHKLQRGKKSMTILDTEVIIEDNFGNSVFGKNKVLIHGSHLILRKLFNVDGSYNFKNLNQILAINPSPALPAKGFEGPLREDCICLFSVGTGGSGDSFESVNQVKYNEIDVKSIVPFRYNTTDLPSAEKSKYALKKMDGTYHSYLAKKFEVKPLLKSVYADGTEVPNNVDVSTREDIDTFIELKLKIAKNECREWFAVKGAGIESARINTLSLLCGFEFEISPGVKDYVELKVVTKYNFKNEALENDKELYITYRIYV